MNKDEALSEFREAIEYRLAVSRGSRPDTNRSLTWEDENAFRERLAELNQLINYFRSLSVVLGQAGATKQMQRVDTLLLHLEAVSPSTANTPHAAIGLAVLICLAIENGNIPERERLFQHIDNLAAR